MDLSAAGPSLVQPETLGFATPPRDECARFDFPNIRAV